MMKSTVLICVFVVLFVNAENGDKQSESSALMRHKREENCKPPSRFDARKQWPKCKNIGVMLDQAQCKASWAIVPASILSDRFCIHTNGQKQVELSAMHLINCCNDCANIGDDKCKTGNPAQAWYSLERDGLVTGGPYNSTSGCLSYKFKPCVAASKKTCAKMTVKASSCEQNCDTGSGIRFKKDKYYAEDMYYLNGEFELQCEIMKNGPIMSSTYVNSGELYGYKSGIYKQIDDNKYDIVQFLKLIGWGEENGVKYWTAINTLGKQWGNKGEFRILRGSNHVGVEESAMAAKPDLTRLH